MKKLSSKFEEVRLVYHNKTKACDRPKVNGPSDAYEIFISTWDKDQIELIEESKLLMLDNHSRLMSIAQISMGGMSEAIVDPRVVFSLALKRRAHRIILAHNHPSGELKPSNMDLELTKLLINLGRMLRVPLEDHLIVTKEKYCSLFSEGYLDNWFNQITPPSPVLNKSL